jgi:hypothetical protein
MATTSFAYNTGSLISGTTQVGDLSVGIPSSGYTSTPPFWEGPEESTGYVIAVPVSGNTQPTYLINPSGNLTLSTKYIGWDISLSNGNQTATQLFGYQQTVLGNTIISPNSKVMFSVLFNTSAPSTLPGSHVIGIGTTSMKFKGSGGTDSAYPGIDGYSMGYCADGTILYNGGVYPVSGLSTWTDNDVIDIVINNSNNTMWVRVNGGYWNNNDGDDPASNTGGFEIINGPFYPALCPAYEGVMTIQNSAEYGVPSGYTLLGSNVTASVGFYRTTGLTDNSFISLAEFVSRKFGNPQTFATASDASTWLTTNGYWNSYGNLATFTISPSDFTNGGPIYQNTFGVGTNGVDGFVNTAAQGNFLEGYYGQGLTPSANSTISAAVTAAGLDPNNSTGYVWTVTWGAGSSISTGYVKFGYYEPGQYFDIQTIDPADADWQLPGYNNGTSLAGTFLFPATFTIYSPLTNKGGWC